MRLLIRSLMYSVGLMPLLLWGQVNNFQFTQHDTAYSGSASYVVQEGDIYSLSTADHDITINRITHSIEAAWSSSFCVGPACLPPFLDSYTFTLLAGDTALFSLDTYPNDVPGVGSWTILAVDSATMEIDSVQITLEFVTTSLQPEPAVPGAFTLSDIFPNPSNAWINFDLQVAHPAHYTLTLFALDGHRVLQRDYDLRTGANHLQWGVKDLPSGNYILQARTGEQVISRSVSVIK